LRVLLVTDEMEVGGTQRQIVNLAVGLRDAGAEVTVLYFRCRSFLVDELERHGVRTVLCAKRRAVDPGFVAALAREIRHCRADVAHAFAFSAELWTAVALALPRGSRPALVSSVRGTYDWYAPWQWRAKRWVSRRSTAIVANSSEGARFAAERMNLPPACIEVVYNGIRPGTAAPQAVADAQLTWPFAADGAMRLLFVGRLVDIKGLDTLLHALAEMRRSGTVPSLVLCGDGPLRAALEQQARDSGLAAHVRFLGERDDATTWMAAADVLVLPSRQEGLSNALLEAMAAGRAVVASRVGGNVELVADGRTGLLVPPGDAVALARALQALAAEPARRDQLGAAAAAAVDERFSVAAMVNAMQRLYCTAAGLRQPDDHSQSRPLRLPARTPVL
jgi:glycosyltransferase involved in cell wall biosynthesis